MEKTGTGPLVVPIPGIPPTKNQPVESKSLDLSTTPLKELKLIAEAKQSDLQTADDNPLPPRRKQVNFFENSDESTEVEPVTHTHSILCL
jgi:hypothetical protein